MIHDFFSFYIVVSKCEEWKVEALLWSAPATLTSLRNCSRACRGYYLAGSKCKPNLCQKSLLL